MSYGSYRMGTNGWGASSVKIPPHTSEGWQAFRRVFEPHVLGDGARLDQCRHLTPKKGEYDKNGTLILGERPADLQRAPSHGRRGSS